MGNSSKRHTRQLAQMERDLKACELLKAGAGFQQISDALKYGGVGNAYRAIKRVKDRLRAETRQEWNEYVEQQWERAEALLMTWWPRRATDKGAQICLRVLEREAALRGLDAPKRTELTGASGSPLIPGGAIAEAARIMRQFFGEHVVGSAPSPDAVPDAVPDAPTTPYFDETITRPYEDDGVDGDETR